MMEDKTSFDFWYAVNNTRIVKHPTGRLETFGATVVHYHLVTEMMDDSSKIRIREGRIEASRPEIITPTSSFESLLEGFGEHAAQYAGWLQQHQQELMILQYGFAVRKQEVKDHLLTGRLDSVVQGIMEKLDQGEDPLCALVVGVEEPWEVCLLKLMIEVVQQSAAHNFQQIRSDPQGRHFAIERAFEAAAQDSSQLAALSQLLRESGLFEEYEDRFFSLVRH